MTRRCLVATVAIVALVGVEHAVAQLPPLIPRDILFGNPERTNPQISPDGQYLAYLAPDEQHVLQVWVRTLGQQDDRKLTADPKRGIRSFRWTYDGEHVGYAQDADGDENWHQYTVNLTSGIIRDLTPFPGIQARFVAADPHIPNEWLVALNLKDRRTHDVYRIDLKTGAVALDTENPGSVIAWTADRQLKVRAATATTPDGGMALLVRQATDQPWETMRQWGPEDQGRAVSFSADGTTLYLVGSHDANTGRLLALEVATGRESVLAEDPQYDVGEVLIHPTTRAVQAVAFSRDKLAWQVLDPSVAADFEALAKLHAGEFRMSTRSLDDHLWFVAYTTDDGPVSYYAYDRPSKTGTRLFSHQPKLEGLALASLQPISYRSRDGLTIHGYLTPPVGVPAKDLPTVLLVHGGPWARDTWGYKPVVQWLANRGYAVLQVNFRGSTGYGKAFLTAGYREWAGKMHDDLIDGVNWLVTQGLADPKKVAIMGASYGGYATLVGLTFTPEVFAAGVDLVGPSNLVTLLNSIPPYWAPFRALWARRLGDPDKDAEFLQSRSPLFLAERIKAPLLIGQGANDPRVRQAESDQIVAALRQANKPVEYVVYTDEGHGLVRPENRLHFYATAEAFLATYLGGRLEAVGELKGHAGVRR
jgi:dipeptidyl aminopeptidase/acylaminoacyl peptidase